MLLICFITPFPFKNNFQKIISPFSIFLFNKIHGDGTYTISCTFSLPNSFEKNLLCFVMQIEHTMNSKYQPRTFQNFKILSNEFHAKLALGIESDPIIYPLN
jgi:hypothetical protein